MSSMVRRHFLLRSSQTPTRNVDLRPGTDSPAELFWWPWGTARAASCLPSLWMGELMSELLRLLGEKPKELLAEARKLLALLLTLLLLRFLSVEPPLSCLVGGLPLVWRFSPLAAWSLVLMAATAMGWATAVGEGGLRSEAASWSFLESSELELEPPNILFSRLPPCEEKLRRLEPASFVEGSKIRGKGSGSSVSWENPIEVEVVSRPSGVGRQPEAR